MADDYNATPGNHYLLKLFRILVEMGEFVMITVWVS